MNSMMKASAVDRAGEGAARWVLACIACLIAALMVTSALSAGLAFADEEGEAGEEGEKPAEATTTTTTTSSDNGLMLGSDYVWAGERANIAGLELPNDILAAGRSISVSDSTVGGDIRAAGQDVSISNVSVAENMSLAGESLSVQGGTAKAVLMGANNATFEGECSDLRMYASSIVINGIVHGDVNAAASAVEIGPNAVIDGTLHVTTAAEPNIASTAKVGKLDVKIEEESTVSSEQLSGTISETLAGLSSTLFIFGIIATVLGTFIIALLAEWLFRHHTAAAAEMIRERTGATIGSGIVGALVAPIVIIVLCCLVITLPVAGALTLALIAMSIVAGGFMGASVFKLAFPKLGRFKCAMAGGAIMGVASAIPFLGSLVGVVAFMYFLGYVLQTVFLSMRTKTPGQPAPMQAAMPMQGIPPMQAAAPAQPVPPMQATATAQQVPPMQATMSAQPVPPVQAAEPTQPVPPVQPTDI